MKMIAFNGSPRKTWNTAMLLEKTLEGAASGGAETELVHLVDLNYQGCMSCFACRLKNGKSYGQCGLKDDLTPVLEKVQQVEALVLGTPIYLGAMSSFMQAFLERLVFPYICYDAGYSVLFKKKIQTGLIFTMNAPEEVIEKIGYDQLFHKNQKLLARIFGFCETLIATDTYQFDDYDKYETSGFDVEKKARLRKELFPIACQNAFEMGLRFIGGEK